MNKKDGFRRQNENIVHAKSTIIEIGRTVAILYTVSVALNLPERSDEKHDIRIDSSTR